MSSSTKFFAIFAALGFLNTGCGSPDGRESVSQKTTATQTTSLKTNEPTQDTVPNQDKPASDTKVLAEVTSFEAPATEQAATANGRESRPADVVPVQIKPATAKDTLAVVNLLDLPRLEENAVLQSGPTYLYYSCKGMLPEADAFYKKMFESRGWKELPPLTQPTEQYIDRLFEKDGFCVRSSLSLGGERGELAILLASLGNVDMRSLPRLPDAEALEPATPVTLTFKTASSIPDAADAIDKQLVQAGWQRWKEFYATPTEVPHYRDMHYRKEACRLLVGIVKNPQNPAEKTSVSYLAEYVTPFDIPTLDGTRTLKLDMFENRAAFEMTNSRKDLVSCLQSESARFGWKVTDADTFVSGDSHMLPIHLDSGAYLVARLVESAGVYSGNIEFYAKAPQKALASAQPSVESAAVTDAAIAAESSSPVKDSTFDELNGQINSAIQTELAKALDSLGGTSSADTAANLADLQAKAAAIQAKLDAADEKLENDPSESDEPAENPFDIAEDTAPPSAEIRSIKKSIGKFKYGGKSYDLPYAACYTIRAYGEPMKCMIFTDSPIDVEKLKRLLLEQGHTVNGLDVAEKAKNMIALQIAEYGVSVDAQLGSMSMGITTTKIAAEVSYYQGKIAGKVGSTEPIDVGQNTLEFDMLVNEPAIKIDWAKRPRK